MRTKSRWRRVGLFLIAMMLVLFGAFGIPTAAYGNRGYDHRGYYGGHGYYGRGYYGYRRPYFRPFGGYGIGPAYPYQYNYARPYYGYGYPYPPFYYPPAPGIGFGLRFGY
jgi:hypothetical protein